MAASMGMGREMIDWNKPIETVDGHQARCISGMATGFIVYVLGGPERRGDVFLVNDKGCRCDARAIYSKRQEPFIRNVRVKREGWVVKMKGLDRLWDFHIYSSEEIALKNAPSGYVVARMEWEE